MVVRSAGRFWQILAEMQEIVKTIEIMVTAIPTRKVASFLREPIPLNARTPTEMDGMEVI